MLETAPILYRGNNSCKRCGNCGNVIKQPEGISPDAYAIGVSVFNEIDFIDNNYFENIEEKYIKEKYVCCEFCDNFGEDITENNIEKIKNYSEYPKIESIFLSLYELTGTYESLIDIYRYYEYKQEEEKAKDYRTKIINILTKEFDKQPKLRTLLTLVDLHRRNSDFETALNLIKLSKKIHKQDKEENKRMAKLQLIKIEKTLCKINSILCLDTTLYMV
jgi:hypothetical protein